MTLVFDPTTTLYHITHQWDLALILYQVAHHHFHAPIWHSYARVLTKKLQNNKKNRSLASLGTRALHKTCSTCSVHRWEWDIFFYSAMFSTKMCTFSSNQLYFHIEWQVRIQTFLQDGHYIEACVVLALAGNVLDGPATHQHNTTPYRLLDRRLCEYT